MDVHASPEAAQSCIKELDHAENCTILPAITMPGIVSVNIAIRTRLSSVVGYQLHIGARRPRSRCEVVRIADNTMFSSIFDQEKY
jgi:hypothetical protein